ncbi:MAG: AIPR family protein [Betaproteobacteria bacterium]
MATAQRPVEMDALCARLEQTYGASVTGQGANEQARLFNFRSRALLAFALECAAGAQVHECPAAIVDGGRDNGIDAIHVAPDVTLWLLQSKYIDAARGEPELGEVNKLCTGVRDLLAGRWNRFNDAVQAKRGQIETALNNPVCRVQVVLVYTGGALADDKRQLLADLEAEFNAGRPGYLRCSVHGLAALHDLHLEALARDPIREVAELRDYGFVEAPYWAVYGRIATRQLAEWSQRFGPALVERNLRRFKGSTEVNDGLAATLRAEPQHLFYFNNGVTLVCESCTQVGVSAANRATGRFELRGVSIINGAQTVGAIAREPVAHYETHPSEVLVTIISLERAPQGFGELVTQNRNRQNPVDIRDFAALDERQQHWHDTLELVGVNYICQTGQDDAPRGPAVFDVADAARALACCCTGHDWSEDVVAASADSRRLFRQFPPAGAPPGLPSPYRRTFPDTLQAKELWRVVQVARLVSEAMLARARTEADPADLPAGRLRAGDILREGRWLALHLLFLKTDLRRGDALTLTADESERVSRALDRIAAVLVATVQAQAWGKQAAAIFQNRNDCEALKAAMMRILAAEAL